MEPLPLSFHYHLISLLWSENKLITLESRTMALWLLFMKQIDITKVTFRSPIFIKSPKIC
ncbi:CLUMA_CG005903, isoform A [Clunio marinus]|uniref:CLUMA_CG005903, isoform A n=1 Tax=Clunio marinus TaxID=568069 RepID=A0A1J1HY83_9DIPT|nr:CLUMA_CG005903, isoform A [Clunio marinus]